MTLAAWGDIEVGNWDAAVLGNGASIAVDERFSYSSLLETAWTEQLISEQIKQIFDYLETKDFELVLRTLTHAAGINRVLGVPNPVVATAYAGIRQALVHVIRKSHVAYEKALPHLDSAGYSLSRFRTVISLNYDILVYWAMIKWNADHEHPWFKDCFIGGRFPTQWQYLRNAHAGAEGSTLVFYPHGNLTLAVSVRGQEIKLFSNNKGKLLDALFERWQSGEVSPLFVSEGTSGQKREAIERSRYLREVHDNVLPDLGESVVIYGWSMGEQDRHLLQAIMKGPRLRRLAVSVMPDGNTARKIEDIEDRIRQEADCAALEITCFDATSPGCWIHQ
jgi:hypothetical protein